MFELNYLKVYEYVIQNSIDSDHIVYITNYIVHCYSKKFYCSSNLGQSWGSPITKSQRSRFVYIKP